MCFLNNKLLRILQFKNSRTPNSTLYKTYNILPFKKLIEYKLLLVVYRWYYNRNTLPEIFRNMFLLKNEVFSHNRPTRNKLDLYIIRCRSTR